MKRRYLSGFLAIVSCLVAVVTANAVVPTPTPTPTPKLRIKVAGVATPTPSPKLRLKQATPTPTPSSAANSKIKTTVVATPTPSKLVPGTGGIRVVKPTIEPAPPEPTATPKSSYGAAGGVGSPTRLPGDVSGSANNPGTPKETVEMTRLMVYTKDGVATTSTGSSEFPSQVAEGAKVVGDFKFKWTRNKAAAEPRKGFLTVLDAVNQKPIGSVTDVAIPAGSTTTNIDFKFPANAKPGQYNGMVVFGAKQISSRVNLTFEGTSSGGAGNVTLPKPGPLTPSGAGAQAAYTINLAKFVPSSTTAPPQLFYTVSAPAEAKVAPISLEVYSQPFTNTQNVTSGSGEHGPIRLFKGTIGPMTTLGNNPKLHSAHLKQSLGSVSLEDWSVANTKTETATFKWNSGGISGAEEKPLHQAW